MSAPESPRSPQKKSKRKATAPRPDQMSPEVCEFLAAIDDFKRAHMRSFLTLEQAFQVLDELGYTPNAQGAARDEDRERLNAAIDEYKKENKRLFPSWSEIFEVASQVGWSRRAS